MASVNSWRLVADGQAVLVPTVLVAGSIRNSRAWILSRASESFFESSFKRLLPVVGMDDGGVESGAQSGVGEVAGENCDLILYLEMCVWVVGFWS